MANTSSTCSKLRLSCKCIQLILACVCIGLFANIPYHAGAEQTLLATAFGGYIIILSGVIFGFICEERISKKIDLLYTLVGLALFIAAGSVSISTFNGIKAHTHSTAKKVVNTGLAMGSIAIINGGFFLLDAVMSYKDVSEYTPHQ